MSWVATAIVGSAVIGAGAGIYSSSKAAGAQSDAADAATQAELAMFEQGREDMAPWREAGTQALNVLMGDTTYDTPEPDRDTITGQVVAEWRADPANAHSDYVYGNTGKLIGYLQNRINARYNDAMREWRQSAEFSDGLITQGPGEFTESPGYQFRLDEAMKQIERAGAASGRTGGARDKAMIRYAEDYATSDYDNFLRRYYDSLNPYLSMAGMGQISAGQGAQNALATGQSIGNNALYGGNARASGYINTANAITGGLQSGMNNYLMYQGMPNYGYGGVDYSQYQMVPGFDEPYYGY